jgi:hypothetical protein
MARSLASPPDFAPVAAAAWSWVSLAAALLAIPVAPLPPAPSFRPVAAHEPVAASAWEGADRVYEELDRRLRGVAASDRAGLARLIVAEAARAELAPLLVVAVIKVESGFDARAVSPAGAVGLMQVMPPTLREELALASLRAPDPFEPAANVRAGVRYLGRLVATFADLELALMAYNAGPARIRHHLGVGGVPARFRGYPRNVLREARRLAPTASAPLARAAASPRRPLAVAHAATRSAPSSLHARTALRHRAPRGSFPAELLATFAAGAARAGEAIVAAVADPRPAGPPAPASAAPERRACVVTEPALPMSRGRERPRPLERPLPS